jgi:hypothetical protein
VVQHIIIEFVIKQLIIEQLIGIVLDLIFDFDQQQALIGDYFQRCRWISH